MDDLSIPGVIAITGGADSGKNEVAEVIAGLRPATSGQVLFGDDDIRSFTADALGRDIAYADSQSRLHRQLAGCADLLG